MSLLIEEEILCPQCKLPIQAELWSILNVREDPELKDLLVGGEINMVECSACRHIFYAEHFLIYHDPDNEFMAFVYPLSYAPEKVRWEEKMKTDFEMTQSMGDESTRVAYEPTALFGLDALVAWVDETEEMNLQGDIVAVFAEQGQFAVRRFKPSVARRWNIPPVLPYKKDLEKNFREAVVAALSDLETINDRLFVYREARKRLIENPALSLPTE